MGVELVAPGSHPDSPDTRELLLPACFAFLGLNPDGSWCLPVRLCDFTEDSSDPWDEGSERPNCVDAELELYLTDELCPDERRDLPISAGSWYIG